MAGAGRLTFSFLFTGMLLATILLPDFLGAGPVGHHEKQDVTETEKAESTSALKKLVRNRRNVASFKRLPDFWGWYKYFMDSNNQERIEDLDRIYMAYLQNKHRTEEGPTFNHYLTHLSEIYKTCANSDDPECIAEYTSKPKAKTVMPAPVKAATVRLCNPYLDPYCLFTLPPKAPEPAPILTPFLPMPPKTLPSYLPWAVKNHPGFVPVAMKEHPGFIPVPVAVKHQPGYLYYAPVLEPFLSAEQKAELLRICNPADVECLQYHLRAAYGYRPAPGPAPSGCHPFDPSCGKFATQPSTGAAAKDGIILPDPDCDPEMDYNCRLRRAKPTVEEKPAKDEPAQQEEVQQETGHADPFAGHAAPEYPVPRFKDFLRGYMGHKK